MHSFIKPHTKKEKLRGMAYKNIRVAYSKSRRRRRRKRAYLILLKIITIDRFLYQIII